MLAIDTSGSVHKDLSVEEEAAKHFVHSLLRPVDHLDLMEFADNVREVIFFTNNAGRIDRGLNDMGRGAATALYSGVYLASQSLAPRSGRKVLVIISDGGNTVKGTTYDMALEQALRGEVMVYPIIDVPIAASAGRDLAGEHALITLAQQTGGRYYYAESSSLDKTFAQYRKTCGRNICWDTIHRTGWAPTFAQSRSSCATRPTRLTSSAIDPDTILRQGSSRVPGNPSSAQTSSERVPLVRSSVCGLRRRAKPIKGLSFPLSRNHLFMGHPNIGGCANGVLLPSDSIRTFSIPKNSRASDIC